MPTAWLERARSSSRCPYPQVMVSRAVNDGEALDAVLRSTNGGGRVDVELSQLRPDASTRSPAASTPSVVADEQGRASVQVDLDGRRELRVAPTA